MNPTVLIAEGDGELRDIYQRFLAARGYAVETAADGLDCLEKLRRQRAAVLVLDWEIRWGGGDGVLAWLREQQAGAGVSVVLTATAGDSVDAGEDLEPPVVTFLPKPFALTALLASVRAAAAEKGRQDPFDLNRTVAHSELYIG